MNTVEELAAEIRARHKLSSFHIFDQDGAWRVFGFRRDAKGYNASVEQGSGPSIIAALTNLDAALQSGPVRAAILRKAACADPNGFA